MWNIWEIFHWMSFPIFYKVFVWEKCLLQASSFQTEHFPLQILIKHPFFYLNAICPSCYLLQLCLLTYAKTLFIYVLVSLPRHVSLFYTIFVLTTRKGVCQCLMKVLKMTKNHLRQMIAAWQLLMAQVNWFSFLHNLFILFTGSIKKVKI